MIGKNSLIGAAGEHHVMSELLQRGVIGALAPEGIPTIDILVSSNMGDRLASLQVKTRRTVGLATHWTMNKKHEDIYSDSLFYCFVNLFEDPDEKQTNCMLPTNQKPETFVVPSKVVADLIKLSHVTWREGKKRDGNDRKDTPMRSFSRNHSNLKTDQSYFYGDGWLDQYRDRWDLLIKEISKP